MSYTKQECIDGLRQANESVEKSISYTQFNDIDIGPSSYTIADRFGSFNAGKEAAGIDTREEGENENAKSHPKVRMHPSTGYMRVRVRDVENGERHSVQMHRLLAAVEHGASALEGMHVHHKNGIKWDNRPENLELLTPEEHMRLHGSGNSSHLNVGRPDDAPRNSDGTFASK